MNTTIMLFLTGLVITIAICLLVVVYLRNHLERILIDLCGTTERAKFWTVFSNVMLILMPLIFSMSYQPTLGPSTQPVFELSNQLRFGLVGLGGTMLVLGFMISRFIPPVASRRYQVATGQDPVQPHPASTPKPPEMPAAAQAQG